MKNSIFNLVPPKQLVAFKILDPVVCRNELSDTRVSNISKIFLGIVPSFWNSYF
jgi:hypothetical protein